jgi:hypothetical protein
MLPWQPHIWMGVSIEVACHSLRRRVPGRECIGARPKPAIPAEVLWSIGNPSANSGGGPVDYPFCRLPRRNGPRSCLEGSDVGARHPVAQSLRAAGHGVSVRGFLHGPRTSRTVDRGAERRAETAAFGRLFFQPSTSIAFWRRTGFNHAGKALHSKSRLV